MLPDVRRKIENSSFPLFSSARPKKKPKIFIKMPFLAKFDIYIAMFSKLLLHVDHCCKVPGEQVTVTNIMASQCLMTFSDNLL